MELTLNGGGSFLPCVCERDTQVAWYKSQANGADHVEGNAGVCGKREHSLELLDAAQQLQMNYSFEHALVKEKVLNRAPEVGYKDGCPLEMDLSRVEVECIKPRCGCRVSKREARSMELRISS
eukprot:389438-Pelagomonas_calceolata.AAC.3